MSNNQQSQINVNIDQDKIDAKYSDQAMINSNPFGFTFDFAQSIPQMNMIKILSRIAMSPQHAKAFSEVLSQNIKAYEQNFGKIELTQKMKDETGNHDKQIGFNVNK